MKKVFLPLFLLACAWPSKLEAVSANSKVTPKPKKLRYTPKRQFFKPFGSIEKDTADMLRGVLNKGNKYKHCAYETIDDKCPEAMYPAPLEINANKGLVKLGQEISETEKNYVVGQKSANAYANLVTLTDVVDNQINVAFCATGGGGRSCISVLGYLSGAQKIKKGSSDSFLDSVIYMSALSGSTWALSLWESSSKTLQEIKDQLKKNFHKTLFTKESKLDKKNAADMLKIIVTKALFGQPIGHTDLWGELGKNRLFNGLFPKEPLKISDTQQQHMTSGSMAFPIYTVVDPSSGSWIDMPWFETTPVSTGFTNVGWVPIWAFDRKFNNGTSVKFPCKVDGKLDYQYAPEQTLGFFLGMWGSLYPINLKNAIDAMAKMNLTTAIENDDELKIQSKEFKAEYKRVARLVLKYLKAKIKDAKTTPPPEILNYAYGMKKAPSWLNKKETFQLSDASNAFQISIPPLLNPQRKIDVIFILDASNNHSAPAIEELRKAYKWAKKHNQPFQDINKYPKLGSESITIMDENNDAPIMVYMPVIKDPKLTYSGDAVNFDLKQCKKGECHRLNFTYTPENFDGLFALAEQNMTQNQSKIEKALNIANERANNMPWYSGPISGTVEE